MNNSNDNNKQDNQQQCCMTIYEERERERERESSDVGSIPRWTAAGFAKCNKQTTTGNDASRE